MSENYTTPSYFDNMSEMGLLWRLLCTFMKRTDLLSIKDFEKDSFMNQVVTFLVFYDKVDILGHFVL